MRLFVILKMFLVNLWYNAQEARGTHQILVSEYKRLNLYENPKYADPLRLGKYEFQVYSQNGEDGILQEIFKRVSTTNKFFVEIGAGFGGVGIENNTFYLLLQGWRGLWVDVNKRFLKSIKNFQQLVKNNKVFFERICITAENAEEIFKKHRTPEEFDLLVVDIDGNDYWVWKAIEHYKPRVVMIEYNALYRAQVEWVMAYSPNYICKEPTQYFGASLKSLELLGKNKGYRLVGCDFTGLNAFFVRNDLVKGKFKEPFTAENHYEPIRYFLLCTKGHKRVMLGDST